MTAGSNGLPDEQDDPFAYLYRPADGEEHGASEADGRPGAQPGVPRRSYAEATQVGRRPAGGQPGTGYGYPPPQGAPQQQYGQQQYAQPQQQPYAQPQPQPQYGAQQPPAAPPPPGGRAEARRGASGGSRRGLVWGAVGVVVAVAAGVTFAFLPDHGDAATAGHTPGPGQKKSAGPHKQPPKASPAAAKKRHLIGSAGLELGGGASLADNHKGAQSPQGRFVVGMQNVGATATWHVKLGKAGQHRLYIRYANGGDGDKADKANVSVYLNGKVQPYKPRMKVFGGKKQDWTNWQTTYTDIPLQQGENTIQLKCDTGDVCSYNIDQMSLDTKM